MASRSCSRADAASRKASTLTDTREAALTSEPHTRTAGLLQDCWMFGCSVRHCAGARTPAACCSSLPHFQLIQTFQELPGAISHRQSPAEPGVEGFVHFGLYFGLRHGGERPWRLRSGLWGCGEADGADRLLGDFLTWAGTSFIRSSQKVPEETSSCCQAEVGGPPRVRRRVFRW